MAMPSGKPAIQVEGFTCIERQWITGNRNYRCDTCGWMTGFTESAKELAAMLATHVGPHPEDKLDLLMMGI